MTAGAQPVRDNQWTDRQLGIAIFCLGIAAGLAMTFVVFRAQNMVDTKFDPYYFGEMGKSLARGDGFTGYGTLLNRRAPLYPLTIGALYWLFGPNAHLMLVLQCIFHGATCWLAFDVGRRLFNRRTGILAGMIIAVHPVMLRYVGDLHLETQLTFLTTALVWQTVRFHERPSLGNGALLGLSAGLAALTKAVVLLYPGLFAAGMLLSSWFARNRDKTNGERKLPIAALAVVFVMMGAVILPWTLRNYRATGHPVLISTGLSDAFLRGMIFSRTEFITLRQPPYTDAENEVNAYFARLCEAEGTTWAKDDWSNEQILNREMKRRIMAEPGLVIRKFFVGIFTFWYQMTSLANSALAGGLALIAWVFAAVGLPRAYKERKAAWLLLLPVVYLNLMLAALLALGRYSAPVLPALLILTAYGVDTLLRKWQAARA